MRSVDLPTPGSPPTRTRLPGTIPPPRTRFSSSHTSGRRGAPSLAISLRAIGLEAPIRSAPSARPAARGFAHLEFLERVPGLAVRALTGPAEALAATLGADKGDRGLGHWGDYS